MRDYMNFVASQSNLKMFKEITKDLTDRQLLRLYGKLLSEREDQKRTILHTDRKTRKRTKLAGLDHLKLFKKYDILQKTCFDVMEYEEEEIKKFFKENPEAILIIYPGGKSYECFSKQYVYEQLKNDSQTFYKCRTALAADLKNIEFDEGVIVKFGTSNPKYVYRTELQKAVDSDSNVFYLAETVARWKYSASLGWFKTTNAFSRDRCQAGTNKKVTALYDYDYTKLMSDLANLPRTLLTALSTTKAKIVEDEFKKRGISLKKNN